MKINNLGKCLLWTLLLTACSLLCYFLSREFYPADELFMLQLMISRLWLIAMLISVLAILLIERNYVLTFFSQKQLPYNLAIFRIIFFGIFVQAIVFYPNAVKDMISPFLTLPDSAAVELPIVGNPYLSLGFDADTTLKLIPFWKIALFASFLGFFTPVSITVYTILTIYLFGIPQFFGKVNHEHYLVWFSAILAVSRCADVLSIDALIRKIRGKSITNHASINYALPLRIIWLLMGLIYFFPGFWKIWDCGFDWAFTDNMRNQMHLKWSEMGDWLPVFRIDQYPALYVLGGTATLVFELSFLMLILHKKTRWLAPVGGLLFHSFSLVFLNINFILLVIYYSAFVNWSWLFSRFRSSSLVAETSPASPSKMLVTVGALLLIVNVYCGFGKINSWPFAVFPLFNSLVDDYYYALDYGMHNEQIKSELIAKLSSERLRAMENRIIDLHQNQLFRERDKLAVDLLSSIAQDKSGLELSIQKRLLNPDENGKVLDEFHFD